MDDKNILKNFLIENKSLMAKCTYDFLKILLRYTKMTVEDFLEIQNGAYVIINGDDGEIYNMFKQCEVERLRGIRYPKSILPKFYTIDVKVPFYQTRVPILGYFWYDMIYRHIGPMSSHGKYMDKAFRMGQGTLVECKIDPKTNTEKCTNNIFDLLVGISIEYNYFGSTAFQFEHSNMATWKNFLKHIKDFIDYRRSSYGKSKKMNVGVFGESEYTDSNPLVIDFKGPKSKRIASPFSLISSPYSLYSAKASSSSKKKTSPSANKASKKKTSPSTNKLSKKKSSLLSESPKLFSQSPQFFSQSPKFASQSPKFFSQSPQFAPQSLKLSPEKLKSKFGTLRGSRLTK